MEDKEVKPVGKLEPNLKFALMTILLVGGLYYIVFKL